jgi:hypothetical protein
VRACIISWYLLVFDSLEFFLVLLPLFVLVLLLCLSFGFRRRPTGIGRAAFCFLGRGVVLPDASI